ncbi:hypothetical protein [Chitinophaga caseinilytica]|uniref:hypothetical protein n=1 Tax=Chitinophaga caseinilytica TaxID=2267521 RepID=UPI003C2C634A
MKKLKLKMLASGAIELLNREQLKNILGGEGGSGVDCTGDKHSVCANAWPETCCFTENGAIYYGTCKAFAPDYKSFCMVDIG